MTAHTLHQTHADIVKRLRRAEGHLKTIVEMIEQGSILRRHCSAAPRCGKSDLQCEEDALSTTMLTIALNAASVPSTRAGPRAARGVQGNLQVPLRAFAMLRPTWSGLASPSPKALKRSDHSHGHDHLSGGRAWPHARCDRSNDRDDRARNLGDQVVVRHLGVSRRFCNSS